MRTAADIGEGGNLLAAPAAADLSGGGGLTASTPLAAGVGGGGDLQAAFAAAGTGAGLGAPSAAGMGGGSDLLAEPSTMGTGDGLATSALPSVRLGASGGGGSRAKARRAILRAGHMILPAVLGRNGIAAFPREGDGATPLRVMRPLEILYRADRVPRPASMLPTRALRPDDGWCDAPEHACYNRPVRHPFPASAEHLWRDDHAYDIIVVLDFNIRPRARHLGSAIFMHVMHDDARPTAGCIALSLPHLWRLLPLLSPRTRMIVGPFNAWERSR